MTFNYQADFGQKLLVGFGKKKTMWKDIDNETKMCHLFSLKVKENSKTEGIVDLVAGESITKEWLFGPSSTRDKTVIYPCYRYRCRVPCPCKVCAKQLSCEVQAKQFCKCISCIENFEDHSRFHATFHHSCKYCDQILEIFPFFNFFFLNTEKKKTPSGESSTFGPKIKHVDAKFNPRGPKLTLEALNKRAKDQSNGCFECGAKFSNTLALREHLRLNHQTGERFLHQYRKAENKKLGNICEECEATFISNKELMRHVKSVHYLVKFPCDQCGKQLSRKDDLLRHKMTIHKIGSPVEFKCEVCNSIFHRKDKFERHKASSLLSDGSVKNKCSECDEIFCTAKFLRDHNKIHQIELSCEECGDEFTLKSSLEPHKLNRSGGVSCDECDKTLCNSVSLNRHKNKVHNCVKCEECGEVFFKAAINNHKLWKH